MKSRKSILKRGPVDIGIEHVTLPNGVETDLAVVRHPGAAAIVALDEHRRVAMIHQFRHAVGGTIWEVPAGVKNGSENALECARRELIEEAGFAAQRWDSLGHIVTIPSFCDERIDLFLARDLQAAQAERDFDEIIRVEMIALDETLEMIRRGEIVDAKTIAALYKARDFLSERN